MKRDDQQGQQIARRFAALAPEARRAFLARLAAMGLNFAELPIVAADPQQRTDAPLSPAQHGMWLTWQLDPDSAAYSMPGLLRLRGRLDRAALQAGLDHLVLRHEALRTQYRALPGQPPLQVVLDAAPLPLALHDLRDLPPAEAQGAASRLATRFAAAPFQLDREAPFRAALIQLAEDEHALALAVHHIAADGWSLQILVGELLQLYQGYAAGAAPALAPLPIQFADYARWQRNWLDAGERERQLAYWRTQLDHSGDDGDAVLALPFDRPRGALAGGEGRHRFSFAPAAATGLRQLAREHGATLYMVMLALFKLTLYRMTGQHDLRVAAPVANRQRAETHGLVGYLTNLQVLRSRLDSGAGFTALLAQVREAVLGGQAHQDLPFDSLVEALAPQRQPGVHPLVQVKCTEQSALPLARVVAGLALELEELSGGAAHFDLGFDFIDDGETIEGVLAYPDALFDLLTMQRWAGQLQACAVQVALQPRRALRELAPPDAEPLALLDGAATSFEHADVLALWASQVRAAPHAGAVRFEDAEYSYAELDAESDRLAGLLAAAGAGPESRVALHAPRGCEFVLGLLAVLKSGAAYVPLDPQLPAERLAFQLADSGARLLLSAAAPAWSGTLPCLPLGFGGAPAAADLTAPRIAPHPQQAAYLIYTSGSTGQPKGVVVTHGALANYVQAVLARLQLPPQASSMAMVSTVAADLGHTTLFGALCSGRLLHLISAERAFDPDRFADYMRRHAVDVLKIVPGHMQALLQAAQAADALPRHTLVIGGESASQALLDRIRALRPACRVVNHYGPTETTVGLLTHAATAHQAAPLPAGRPLANAGACIMDADLNLAPVGVSGELYLGGAGLARGYQGRAGMTAERFVPHPLLAGQRLYRSGDRARLLADGAIEFLGRADDQVKIRGYRVEPREVAAALLALDGVAAAEVLAAPDSEQRLRLLAYVVCADRDGAALARQLAATLPDYMVPAAIVVMQQLPLTANGKVDRKRLPAPEQPQGGSAGGAAPQGEVEQKLAAIWAEVLKVGQVGRDDNFFALGGDSILTLQIVARARKAGIRFSPRHLMEKQTVAALAALAQPAAPAAVAAPAPSDTSSATAAFALTPVQRWFFEQPMAARHHWNQSVLLELDAPPDGRLMQQALWRLAERHGALRLRFGQHDGAWMQREDTAAPLPNYTHINLGHEADAGAAIARESGVLHAALDLQHGPLLRAAWLDIGAAGAAAGRLLLVCHHLVVDAVSWRLLLEDLQAIYHDLLAGRPPQAAPDGASFADWSRALQQHAATPGVQAQLAYWQAQSAPPLPADHALGTDTEGAARTIHLALDRASSAQLLGGACGAYRNRPEELMLAALAHTLCRWSGNGSVLVELEGHGREDFDGAPDPSRTAGWFTSLYPVRLVPAAGDDIAGDIVGIKEQLRQVPGKGLGYGLLRYLGGHGAELARLPAPQLTFNYLGKVERQAGAGWTLADDAGGQSRAPDSPRRCCFDLTLMVRDGCLLLDWTYSANRHAAATVEALAHAFVERLRQVLAHGADPLQGRLTPSDVPLCGLDQAALDALALPARRIEDMYPLSPMQAGMLFHSQYQPEPGGAAYVNQLSVDIGGLRVAPFAAAWRAAIARHAVLRSAFVSSAAAPLQWVARDVDLPLREIDLRGQAGAAAEADRLARAELERGFDLASAPLMRLLLLRLDGAADGISAAAPLYRLVWTCHHLLLDGWSSSSLLAEVLREYAGETVSAPAGRYRDHIAWLQAQDRPAAETWWRGQLARIEQPTRLADVLAAPALQSPALPATAGAQLFGGHQQVLDGAVTARLLATARRERITLNTLVQGAWILLLQRYTGQAAVTVGVTTAGRPAELAGAEQVLGLFINTLPLTAAPSPGAAAGDWLRALQADNLAMREHEHTPLVELQRWAGHGGQALFDTLIVFENFPMDQALLAAAPGGLRFGAIGGRDDTHYPLTITAVLAGGVDPALRLHYSYDAARFSAPQVAAIAAQAERLLAALADTPQLPCGALPLLASDAETALLAAGDNPRRYPADQAVHRLIERQAALRPDAPALAHDGVTLSHAELNRRANRLARQLSALGVGPERRVGVALERSIEMVVAVLAILKAGGAYVPLDPAYPAERLAAMMDDSGVMLMLAQSGIAATLPRRPGLALLEVVAETGTDAAPPELQSNLDLNLDLPVHPDSLVYLIYTSGSTGKPKGIGVAHRALAEHAQVAVGYFGLTPADRMLLFSTINFDGFVEQLFPPLVAGAAVVLRGPALWDSDTFYRTTLEQGITIADLSTAYWNMLVQDFARHGVRDYGALRQVQATGEAMPPEALQAWRAAGLGHVKLLNTYGPTEAIVTATAYDCAPYVSGGLPLPAQMPIGQPLAGRRAYVLDAELRLAPPGVPGELCLGGELLARAYAGRAGLSAERFIADPYGPAGARLYRTGDLVRWSADGRLEYLGRFDHQVKIRGFRIELGEIEAQLMARPGVREAVALALSGGRLAAYVTGENLDGAALRQGLAGLLPDYMVPAVVVVLAALPLTPGGKIDRKALPAPDFGAAVEQPLDGAAEQALGGLWRELLGLERVGRDSHFFESGGHSLLAIQLCSRVRSALRAELPLRAVFAHPRLADMAAHIVTAVSHEAAALLPVARRAAMPLSPVQHRLWLVDRLASPAQRSAYNIAAALRLSGALDPQRLQCALNALVRRHEVLRTSYPHSEDGDPYAAIAAVLELPLPLLDLSAQPPAQARRSVAGLLAEQRRQPFELEHGPLLRMALLRLDPRQHVLLLCVHHMVFDGWSEAVFLRELAACYQGAEAGLPALPVQYADYAAWHAAKFEGPAGAASAAFWRDYLAGAPALSTLPGDGRPSASGPVAAVRSALAPLTLTADAALRLEQLGRSHGATLFMVLLAAFLQVLHRESGQDDLVVGTDTAGRDRTELEGLIGFFVNVVPLRSRRDAAQQDDFGAWLERVRDSVLRAFEHGDLPFDQIVDAAGAGAARERGRHPLLQTLFVLQNVPAGRADIDGLAIELLPDQGAPSKFELAVFVSQEQGKEQDKERGSLRAEWIYHADRHQHATVARAAQAWQRTLDQLAGVPGYAPAGPAAIETEENTIMTKPAPAAGKLDRLNKLSAPRGAARPAVSMSFLRPGQEFPAVIEARDAGLDAVAWAREQRDLVESMLLRHGGILFRGFGLRTAQEFESFAEAIEPQLHGDYGDLPKKEGGRNIYRSTPYPERQMILFHNESAHLDQWPRKQWFFCELPSPVGGATPIVDCREMLRRLPAELVAEFERKQLLYIRTFNNRLDVSWQDFFKTTQRAEVETRLRLAGIDFEWLDNDELQTRTRCPAVIAHPVSGERAFFNQVQLHHVSCLEPELRADLLTMVGAHRLPRQVCFGDGSPIPDATMELIGRTYEECAVRFDWRQGDVIMLDNMLAAHARDPFEGPRKIVVAMGEMVRRADLEQQAAQPPQQDTNPAASSAPQQTQEN
ncbi:non-ribosomal peptide synthetase [Janthinobacterium agaricidamnosum]|uniref:NRPS II ORF 2 n=1 Tax=Janthinobacterium agaricidamnosum NBRC 102515 = DSM 9628 TaxID=1349767 RepID=W0V3C9_9BURK|nr:non-ribosomal peptide synthetase [Janthinobacterium agaricidamnosum]CDG82376.1 NRPS II ORF 2 [Janthinobacterium agaricidamnosum NBRC 102515 = DSM 9628]